MGELACLDALQLSAIIFGTAFATLAVCAAGLLAVLYALSNRRCKFAQKVPGLEKLIAISAKRTTKSAKENDGANSKLNFETTPKTQQQAQHQQSEKEQQRQQRATEIKQQFASEKQEQQHQQQKQPTSVTATRMDSMEEISLTDTSPDDIRLIKRVASKLSQSEGSQPDFRHSHNMTPPTFKDAGEYDSADYGSQKDAVMSAKNTLKASSVDAQTAKIITQTKTNTVVEEETKINTGSTNQGAQNGGDSKCENAANSAPISLSAEQCRALEANRERLEAERQQLRQLGII